MADHLVSEAVLMDSDTEYHNESMRVRGRKSVAHVHTMFAGSSDAATLVLKSKPGSPVLVLRQSKGGDLTFELKDASSAT